MELAIMIEGQAGLNWQRWMRLGRAVEDLGYAGLYRSDHFTNGHDEFMDSLELWISLTWLAANTRRIEFGPLVTPVSFRHPVFTARWGIQVDNLSGGRLQLGVGAGWQEREHGMFGFDLLATQERFARFEEGLQVITRLIKSNEPVSFEGRYYHLEEAALHPRPEQHGGPRIIIGGNSRRWTLPLAACYADEWNGFFMPPEKFTRLSRILDTFLQENERKPQEVRRTLMTNLRYGRNDGEVHQQLRTHTIEELREVGILVGTGSEVVDQLGRFAEAGVQRVMLQWLDLDAIDRLEAFAAEVLPQMEG